MNLRISRLKWLAIPVGLVAIYAIVGFYVVPGSAAQAIRDYTAKQLHRESSVGLIRFNPFTLDAQVHDLAILDTDHKPMLGFSNLHVRLGLWASITRRGYVVSTIEVDDLAVSAVRHADQSINLMALVPPSKPDEKPTPLPRVFIDSFAMRNGSVAIVDQARAQALNLMLKPVTFELKDFRTTGEDNAYGFSAKSTRGESLDWHGTFGLQPVESSGSFELGHILATTIAQVGLDLLPLDITKGEIDVSGQYAFADGGKITELKLDVSKVRVRDLGLRARGESEDWVTVPGIAIDGTTLDLASQTINVASIKIDNPQIKAWLDHAGNLNLAKLYSTKAAPPSAAPTDKISKPWKIAAPLAEITALDARVEDRTPAVPVAIHLSPVDIAVRGFALPLAAPVAIDVKAGINGTGMISASGPVSLDPLAATLAVAFRTIELPFLQPYVEQYVKLDLLKGSVGGDLKVDYKAATAGKAAPINVTGDVAIRSLHTQDKLLHLDFVNWNLLALKGLEVHTDPFSLQIHEVIANQPYARVVIGQDQKTNLAQILGTGGADSPPSGDATGAAGAASAAAKPAGKKATASPPKPAPKDEPVAIRVVRVEDGSMNFADFSVKPNFATGIDSLSGTIRGLSGKTGTRADVDLKGKVDRYAPVTIAGKINPLSADSFTDIKFAFRNLELTTFSPYSGKFAGYRVEKGKMSVEFAYHIENRKLDAKHKLILDQLELGEKVDSPDATSLPVKFAISLLKDVNGVIDIDLPVSGSLDDPQFRIAPLVWKVLVNLLEKAVTAPFKLLGSLFGGGAAPEQITFVPGSAELDQGANDTIGALKKGLAARPALKLDVPMAVCPDADSSALMGSAWDAHVRELTVARLSARKGGKAPAADAVDAFIADPKLYHKLLEDSYKATHGGAPPIPPPAADADADEAAVSWLENALKPDVKLPANALADLGRARAEAVQRVLLDNSGIDPSRVFIITDKATNCEDAAFVQMKLGLK